MQVYPNYAQALPDLLDTPQLETLLIDVNENKLVEATTSTRYLALSYVWGKKEFYTTMREERETLAKKNSLAKISLPNIVCDAMSFTRKMKERYLWVDALCIEQDKNSEQKMTQIANMDTIYRNAYLTLVAWTATGSSSRLPGVSELKLKPQIIRKVLNGLVLENTLLEDLKYLHDYSEISHYETRGWTFQERILSRRCLFFHERDALFVDEKRNGSCGLSCLTTTGNRIQSTGKLIVEPEKGRSMSTELYELIGNGSKSVAPQLEQYTQFVEQYMKLDLSYETDRLNAFRGLLKYMSPDIGDYVAGLPISSSPRCLLWAPLTSDQSMVRNFEFASWSWIGWKGRISYLNFSDSSRIFQIEKIRGSKDPHGETRLLWDGSEQQVIKEAGANVLMEDIRYLHFQAETYDPASSAKDPASSANDIPGLPNGHIYVLMTIDSGNSGNSDIKAMEVKPVGDCFERIGMHFLNNEAWTDAKKHRQSICLG